ncbi:MAG: hypothetical protein KGL53_00255, partial [Elusimicrobia bacterium]|nr:hypothetical protein [Elusimicrobiota bacterium]
MKTTPTRLLLMVLVLPLAAQVSRADTSTSGSTPSLLDQLNGTAPKTDAPASSTDSPAPAAGTAAPTSSPLAQTVPNYSTLSPDVQKTLNDRAGKVLNEDQQLVAIPKNLPAYAQKAMAQGMTPVVDPQGNILGFDDPVHGVCMLPSAVQSKFPDAPGTTSATAPPAPPDSTTAPDAAVGVANGITPGSPAPINSGAPIQAGARTQPPASGVAAAPAAHGPTASMLQQQLQGYIAGGNLDGATKTIQAMDAQTQHNNETTGTGSSPSPNSGPFTAMSRPSGPGFGGTNGGGTTNGGATTVAGTGPSNSGPQGQVANGPIQARQVTGYDRQRAQSYIDFYKGLSRAPLDPGLQP